MTLDPKALEAAKEAWDIEDNLDDALSDAIEAYIAALSKEVQASEAVKVLQEELRFYSSTKHGALDGIPFEHVAHVLKIMLERVAAPPQPLPATNRGVQADAIVTSLYGRFKDWSKKGFGPDDVTWCEVKADVLSLIAALSVPAPGTVGALCMWTDKPCTCGGADCEQVDFGASPSTPVGEGKLP